MTTEHQGTEHQGTEHQGTAPADDVRAASDTSGTDPRPTWAAGADPARADGPVPETPAPGAEPTPETPAPGAEPTPDAPAETTVTEPVRRAPRRVPVWALAAAMALTGGGGIAVGAGLSHARAASTTASAQVPAPRWGSGSTGDGSLPNGGQGGFAPGSGAGDGLGSGSGTSGGTGAGTGSGTSGTSATTAATAAQSVGVVTIDSDLSYQDGESMGTGIVLTSSGEVLTNNHVVEGSTSVKVTVVSTGQTYTASVVGTDATDDVAVLRLQGASGLAVAKLASAAVHTGDAVTGVGNAGGTGSLTAATGTVTATGASITTEAEGSAASESLKDLIATDAGIQSGDSGGPLLDASGQVVGIDTAASSGGTQVQGFAIPIATATSIARQIESGTGSAAVTIGLPAFLGVELSPTATTTGGAVVEGTVPGGPAARAGITAGSTITAVAGTPVASGSALSAALATHRSGDAVSISWTDAAGAGHQATVTLVDGPAA